MRWAAGCGWIALIVGCSVLIGWSGDIVWLKSIVPGFIAMNPLTAVCFCAGGLALLLQIGRPVPRAKRLTAQAAATLMMAVGATRISDYVLESDFGLDRLLFAASLESNRVAPNTALCLVLCGLSLLLVDVLSHRRFWPAQSFACLAATIALVSLVGYGYGAESLYRVESCVPMALHTATVLLVLSLGILLSRGERGIMAAVLDDGLGGSMARRLVPAVVGIPIVLGWLRILGQEMGLYEMEFGAAFMVAITVVLFLVVISWIAAALNRADLERQQTLDKLLRSEREVRQLNEDLESRVRERTVELAAANADLLQKNRENELFVYSVSHDLRSPLVNMQGFSKELGAISDSVRKLIESAPMPTELHERSIQLIDQDMQRSIRFIQTAVSRLSGIIDALLRLSRAGRVEYRPQAVNVANVVGRIVEAMSGSIYDRSAAVEFGELPAVWGDAVAVEQVFANLINNAVNYLDPQRAGRIEIGSMPSKTPPADGRNWRTFYVKDNGLGIPEAYHEKIFQALKRLHPEVAPGEGIGLAIVRRIVERHGGTIWFESERGVGTTFFVDLPCAGQRSSWPPAANDLGHVQRKNEHDARSLRNPVGGR